MTSSAPSSPIPPARSLPISARTALRLSVLLLGVYVLLDVIAQLLPPHYSPISQAESDLAVGPFGWIMTLNFVVRGVLSLLFLAGLGSCYDVRHRPGAWLLGAWALGAFVLASSPTDVGGPPTLHGTIHLVAAALAFLFVAVGELWMSLDFERFPILRPVRPWALGVAVLDLLALLALFVVDGRPHLANEVFGLVERTFLALSLLWMLLVSVYLLRQPGPWEGESEPKGVSAPAGS